MPGQPERLVDPLGLPQPSSTGMTLPMASSYKRARPRTKAITVRISEARLKKLMRARKAATQSELIQTLLLEEEERVEAERVLRQTWGVAGPEDFDARLL